MRIRTGLSILACCAAITACTAAPSNGPDATVTAPAIGRPAAPASEAAALDSEAFTPHADIGASASDGLALGDTYQALGTACGAMIAQFKCINIVSDFNNAMFAGALAGIETMNNEISTDVVTDSNFKKAMVAWSARMARNGYTAPDADDFALNELRGVLEPLQRPGSTPSSPTAAEQQAQIAMA
jgi:hypothetical protein